MEPDVRQGPTANRAFFIILSVLEIAPENCHVWNLFALLTPMREQF